MIPMDCHTHTNCSPDSGAALGDMLKKAESIGLSAYAVTDHIELCRFFSQGFYGVQPRNAEDFFDYHARYEASVEAVTLAKSLYSGKMQILCGIEMGEPDADFSLAESIQQDSRLDFVIASLHELQGELDFYFLNYDEKNPIELLDCYFASVLKICQWGKFDVLGHITYPLRYMTNAGVQELSRWEECIAESFRAVIRNGKGIELNTSGYRQTYGKPFPHRELLKLYRDLGGTILTLGSDAHCPEDVGSGIEQGVQLAKSVGFDKVCYFLRHEPHWIKI